MTAAGVILGRGQEAGHEPQSVLHRGAIAPARGGGPIVTGTPAWPAQDGGRPAPVRGRELTTGTRPGASYGSERGSSGSPSGRGGEPDGDTGTSGGRHR